MKISTHDVLVLRAKTENASSKSKYVLGRVVNSGSPNPLVRLEILPHHRPQRVPVESKDIVVNLGPEPPAGKVYGCDLSQLYRTTVNHKDFGPVHFMCKPSPEDRKKLGSAMSTVAGRLRKAKLGFLLEEGTLIEVVNHAFTKYSGMFYASRDREKHPSRLLICADSKVLLAHGVDSYEYVLAHELGHALHFHHLKSVPAIDSAWVKAYWHSVRPKRVDDAVAKEFLGLVKKERNVAAAMGQLDEENQDAAKLVLKWVRTTGGLGTHEINLLLETDRDDVVEEVWPVWDLVLRDLRPKLTLYSTKNYKELFAEAFAFWLTGKDLPPKLLHLMERSVQVARG